MAATTEGRRRRRNRRRVRVVRRASRERQPIAQVQQDKRTGKTTVNIWLP